MEIWMRGFGVDLCCSGHRPLESCCEYGTEP